MATAGVGSASALAEAADTVGSTSRSYEWDYNPDGSLELSPNGTPLVQYVWGLLGPVARVDLQNGANARYYVLDARGHARAMVDSTGSVTDYYEYDAWGNLLPGSYGSTPNLFKWNAAAGYQHVPFTGLYHVDAREYDPRTARWLQRDPIGIASGDPNLYRYCGNDAVNASDPSGLEPPGFREYVAAFFSRDTWSVGLSVGVKSVAHTFSWGFYDPGEEVKQHPGWQGSQGYANAGENILSLGKGQVRRSAMNMAKERAKAQIKKTRAQIADELCLSPGNPLRKQTRSQLAKGLRSLEERIAEHEENLRRVSVSPMSFAKFKNADPSFRQRIIDSDIRHWKGELKNFREQIKTIQRLLGGSDD